MSVDLLEASARAKHDLLGEEIVELRADLKKVEEELAARGSQVNVLREMKATAATGMKHQISVIGESGELEKMFNKYVKDAEGSVGIALEKLVVGFVTNTLRMFERQTTALEDRAKELVGSKATINKQIEKAESRQKLLIEAAVNKQKASETPSSDRDSDGRPLPVRDIPPTVQ